MCACSPLQPPIEMSELEPELAYCVGAGKNGAKGGMGGVEPLRNTVLYRQFGSRQEISTAHFLRVR